MPLTLTTSICTQSEYKIIFYILAILNFITARIRRMTGGYIFTLCQSIPGGGGCTYSGLGGGTYLPRSGWGGGGGWVPTFWVVGGTYFQVWIGGGVPTQVWVGGTYLGRGRGTYLGRDIPKQGEGYLPR